MRANLLWLVALLGAVAAFVGYGYRPEPHIFSLRLMLCTRPLQIEPPFVEGDFFRMELMRRADGSARMSSSQRMNGVVSEGLEANLSAQDWSQFERGLLALPGWRERQCDGGEPEGQALYTRLEIETQQGPYVSCWRGLPKPQAEVAGFLLASPVGAPLKRVLVQLQSPQPGAQTSPGGVVPR